MTALKQKTISLFSWGIALGLFIATLIGIFGDTFGPMVAILIAMVITPIITIAFIINLYALIRERKPEDKQTVQHLACLALFMLFQMFGTVLVASARDGIDAHQTNCEKLLPQLEAFRSANGSYPKDLSTIGDYSALSGDSGQCGYTLVNANEFELSGPGPGFSDAIYNSQTEEWEYVGY